MRASASRRSAMAGSGDVTAAVVDAGGTTSLPMLSFAFMTGGAAAPRFPAGSISMSKPLIALRAAAVAGAVWLTMSAEPVAAQAVPPAPPVLTGKITSDREGPMEGVLVSARKSGATIAVTVVSDARGDYAFP